jgi:hypothetical protein
MIGMPGTGVERVFLVEKMGRMAYWRDARPELAWEALGDATRGGFLATVAAVRNLERPAAPTPRAAGLSVL